MSQLYGSDSDDLPKIPPTYFETQSKKYQLLHQRYHNPEELKLQNMHDQKVQKYFK